MDNDIFFDNVEVGKKWKILIIDDDIKLATLLASYLEKQGFVAHHADNGEQGLHEIKHLNPDLIILDLMMPLVDGLSVCRLIQDSYNGRILVLTASDDDMDQVAALEIGAHDFVCKPIHPRVLLARIRALLRRDEPSVVQNMSMSVNKSDWLCFGKLRLHSGRRRVELNGARVKFTEAEFELLWFLATNPEIPLSRSDIMMALRGIEHDGLNRSVDNRILILRKKLGDTQGLPKRIITVRGKGYMFVTDQW